MGGTLSRLFARAVAYAETRAGSATSSSSPLPSGRYRPSYGILFHELGSDAIFAAAFAATLAVRLNQASRWYPPPVLWLVVGIVALAVRPPARLLALSAPTLAALIVVILAALGAPAIPHFSVPMTPVLALLAAGALLGPRRPGGTGSSVV